MKKALLLSLAIGSLSMAAYAQTVERSRLAFTNAPAGPQFIQLTGTCAMSAAPDIAVVLGGIASGALKPIEAVEQLDQHLGIIRAYLEEAHGRLQLMERVRTLINPSSNPNERESPFQVVQRLSAEFSADAPIDAILQRLVELGLDRFGDNVLNSNGSRRTAVVLFRFNDFDAKMRNLQKQCIADAWKEWCVAQTSAGTCSSEEPPAALQLQSFAVRSTEKLLRPDGGGAQYWQFTYTGAQSQAEPLELLGKVVVHFSGTIMLTYRLEGKP
jgi:hypothetical protein